MHDAFVVRELFSISSTLVSVTQSFPDNVVELYTIEADPTISSHKKNTDTSN